MIYIRDYFAAPNYYYNEYKSKVSVKRILFDFKTKTYSIELTDEAGQNVYMIDEGNFCRPIFRSDKT